jgi:ComF family protein
MSVRGAIITVGRQLSDATGAVLEFCYPSVCAVCSSIAPPGERWCEKCDLELENLQFAPACDVCAMPLAEHLAPCPYCEGKGLKPFKRIARLGIFASPLKDLIHRVKYSNDWPLGERLAERLAQQDSVQAILAEPKVLIPVPLFWRRQAWRGFNQAELIARVLAKQTSSKAKCAVVRLRDTPTQTALQKRAQRMENLQNAFGTIDPTAIRGKDIVLVDDVVTTAATLQTLAREVRRHDPASVSAIVMSIADPKGRAFEVI